MSKSLSKMLPQKEIGVEASPSSERNAAEAEALFVEAEKLQEQGALKKAHEALLQAAALGHTGAQVTLGNNFSSGVGVDGSDEKAAYWYKRAYREGDESGALNLAIDKLRDHNTRAAVFWFNRARLMGSGEATLELAKIFLTKKQGKVKAIRFLEMTQEMKPREISDDAKEEAARLLSSITTVQ